MSRPDPFHRGKAAAHQGQAWWRNPYPPGTCDAEEWLRGHTIIRQARRVT